jgi:hypothetical protein
VSALPRTNNPGLDKVVSWIVGHGDMSKLWRQGERGLVVGHADGRTDHCRVPCASFYKLVVLVTALLLVDSFGRCYDLCMAAPPHGVMVAAVQGTLRDIAELALL